MPFQHTFLLWEQAHTKKTDCAVWLNYSEAPSWTLWSESTTYQTNHPKPWTICDRWTGRKPNWQVAQLHKKRQTGKEILPSLCPYMARTASMGVWRKGRGQGARKREKECCLSLYFSLSRKNLKVMMHTFRQECSRFKGIFRSDGSSLGLVPLCLRNVYEHTTLKVIQFYSVFLIQNMN